MSTRVEYVKSEFVVQRLQSGSWITIKAASVSGSEDYNLQDNTTTAPISYIATPIIGAQNATLTFTRYGLLTHSAETILGSEALFDGDTVRIQYNGGAVGSGDGRYTVESVDVTETRDTTLGPKMGLEKRIDVSAQLGGLYADLLSRSVSWTTLPAEPWIDRIRRYVTVTGWPGGV